MQQIQQQHLQQQEQDQQQQQQHVYPSIPFSPVSPFQPPKNMRRSTNTLDHFFYNQQPKIRYYRIIYRGFVALLNEPKLDSKKTGAYVSYGEIIATTAKEVEIKLPPPSTSGLSLRIPPYINEHELDKRQQHEQHDNYNPHHEY